MSLIIILQYGLFLLGKPTYDLLLIHFSYYFTILPFFITKIMNFNQKNN